MRVQELGRRRGPAPEARRLYAELDRDDGALVSAPDTRLERRRRFAGTARGRERRDMTYVVTDNCIKCKYMDCVEVCPVDCFYEGENMLVIHPDECIDCGVCEPECPAEAIKPDTEPGLEQWLKLNAEYGQELAEHHRKEGAAGGRQGASRRGGQVREVLLAESRRGRLSSPVTRSIGLNRRRPSEAEQICGRVCARSTAFQLFSARLQSKYF